MLAKRSIKNCFSKFWQIHINAHRSRRGEHNFFKRKFPTAGSIWILLQQILVWNSSQCRIENSPQCKFVYPLLYRKNFPTMQDHSQSNFYIVWKDSLKKSYSVGMQKSSSQRWNFRCIHLTLWGIFFQWYLTLWGRILDWKLPHNKGYFKE